MKAQHNMKGAIWIFVAQIKKIKNNQVEPRKSKNSYFPLHPGGSIIIIPHDWEIFHPLLYTLNNHQGP